MTPTVGGTIDSTFFAEYDTTVQAALASGDDVYVILDLVSYVFSMAKQRTQGVS